MSANVDWLSLPAELSAKIWRLHPEEQARLSRRRHALRKAKRVEKEMQFVSEHPVPGISVTPHADNVRYHDITLQGPLNSPFEGGVFLLELFVPEDFPDSPPRVRFLTQVYHPCVYRLGLICPSAHTVYDMPYQGPWRPTSWGPSMRIIDMIKRLLELLQTPPVDTMFGYYDLAGHRPGSSLRHWYFHREEAIQQAREWTQMYATSGATHESIRASWTQAQHTNHFWKRHQLEDH